ncbi:Estradiol 17-beta-dehydrogenase 11 [Cladophialophora carrionii]|uniref:Estradiol 17-beta-dehydrogenase 11 n=1 Tax=Cladophialophora carrionii TaxID=86049 RepID=A0A1C1CKC4_9EURO|nr:Estradiol 17-beta-dehydrogenase 11 [Cladophialophora carrionii]
MGDANAPPFPAPVKGWHADTYPGIDPSRPELSLKGKSVIVSGGGGTIGFATVKALATAGVRLVGIVGRTQKTLDETSSKLKGQYPGTKIVSATGDISSFSSLESAFKQIRQQAGNPVDILVHNAGHLASPGPIATTDPKEWWTSFEVNILGAFNSIRAFLPVAPTNATIVNMSTAVAHVPTTMISGLSAYSSSKLAALRIFDFLQDEHPEMHIVNMHPGIIMSDLNSKHGAATPMDTPELAASFVVWLCSPEAKFLKGKLAWANWDVDDLKAKAAEIQNSPSLTMALTGWSSLS